MTAAAIALLVAAFVGLMVLSGVPLLTTLGVAACLFGVGLAAYLLVRAGG